MSMRDYAVSDFGLLLDEETIKDSLEMSQQQRLHLRPISIQ